MNIGITISRVAYTPEAFAYERYLTNLGHNVELQYELDPNNDINIYFMGLRPFWKKSKGKALEIHEYQSLSTPPHTYIKNKFKKFINSKPNGRIFLNNIVRQNLNFKDNIPYIYRDMGVENELFQKPSDNPTYDIVYCGSIKGRPGLIENILKLSETFKIVVIGNISNLEKEILNHKNITLVGTIDRASIADIYRESRYGLNYTPNIYPYNIQTSTKTLEYLAAGLDVISNKYKWSESFFSEINYQPYWLEEIILLPETSTPKRISTIDQVVIQQYSWDNILTKSNFDSFLRDLIENKFN